MKPIEKLESAVKALYESKNPDREEWADWLADNHVWVVADYATELAKKHGANEDLARAAALLHDGADAIMARDNERHEAESLRMARELMEQAGFTEDEIKLVVDDAIRYHSCHGDERPNSLEGKCLSTADSMAHLKTDFYIHATYEFGRDGRTLDQLKQWVLQKIERDINNKMFFNEVREELLPSYQMLKELFSR